MRSANSAEEMRVQQQQAGNNRQYRITKQMNPMTHFFTISLNHYGQLFNAFRRSFSLIKAIQSINNRKHSDHKINTDIHAAIVTELINKQYRQFDNVEQSCHNLTRYPALKSCIHMKPPISDLRASMKIVLTSFPVSTVSPRFADHNRVRVYRLTSIDNNSPGTPLTDPQHDIENSRSGRRWHRSGSIPPT